MKKHKLKNPGICISIIMLMLFVLSTPVTATPHFQDNDSHTTLSLANHNKMAFVRCDTKKKCNLWVMNPDGSDQTQVTDGIQVQFRPTWSPDGKEIAFSSWNDKKIHIINLETGQTRRLAGKGGCAEYDPAWSPDGSIIAHYYQCGNIGGISPSGIGYIDTMTGEVIDIFFQQASFSFWSPNGKKIGVVRGPFEPGDKPESGLYIYDRDGTNPVKLTGQIGSYPSWSPDGKWIAQQTAPDGVITLYSISGGDPQPLIKGNYPDWSPYGTQLAFSDDGIIKIINLANRQVRQIAEGWELAWYKPSAVTDSSPSLLQEPKEGVESPATILQEGKQSFLEGHSGQALGKAEQALALFRQRNDLVGESACLSLTGQIYSNWGEFEHAIDYFRDALLVAQKASDKPAQLEALIRMSIPLEALGQYNQIQEISEKVSLILPNQLEGLDVDSEIWIEIANLMTRLGEYKKAIEVYQHAQKIARQIQDRNIEGQALLGIGITYVNQKQPSLALRHLEQARDIFEENEINRLLAEVYYFLGFTFESLQDYEQAFANYSRALDIYQNNIFYALYGEVRARAALARIYFAQDKYQEAISASNSAIYQFEQMNTQQVRIPEFRLSFIDNINIATNLYEIAVLSNLKQGNYLEALNNVEQSKARVLLDRLVSGPINLDHNEAREDLLVQKQSLQRQIADLQQQLSSLTNLPADQRDQTKIVEIHDSLNRLESQYSNLLIQIWRQDPEYSVPYVKTASLGEIQNLLDEKITLIEYFVTQNQILAFIITRDMFETVILNVGHDRLVETISTFRDFSNLDDPYPVSLQKLHKWLIEPLKPYLKTPVIGIIPHNILHYLPFSALTDGKHYFGDEYILFNLPSASTLRFIQEKRKPNPNTILVLGNPTTAESLPNLHFAQQEAELIADLYDTHALVGDAATESAIWSQASDTGILHLAAHSTYNLYNPLFSAIHLAKDDKNDGRLEVHEIYSLNLTKKTDLVVLSACETSIGELSTGDEIVSLNRAFFSTGTPTIIASLWNVDDEATAQLMAQFYTHLREGVGKAEALRQAQLEVREKYPNPYYWAAFVLSGDAGKISALAASTQTITPTSTVTDKAAATPPVESATPPPPAPTAAAPQSGGCLGLVSVLGLLGVVGVFGLKRRYLS